jgi:hypothetical protein
LATQPATRSTTTPSRAEGSNAWHGRRWKVGRRRSATTWPRKDVTITAEQKKTTAAIDISLPDGTTFEVESMMLGEGPKQLDEFLSAVGQ